MGLLVGCYVDERFATLQMKQPELSDPFRVASWRLKNGLKLAVLHDPRARISSIDLRFDVGTSDDPSAPPGIALLTGEALALHAAQDDIELSAAVSIDLDRTDIAVTAIDLPDAIDLAAGRLATTCPRSRDAAADRRAALVRARGVGRGPSVRSAARRSCSPARTSSVWRESRAHRRRSP